MSLRDNIANRLGLVPLSELQLERAANEAVQETFQQQILQMRKELSKLQTVRSFQAAVVNRLTSDWLSTQSSIDADIRSGLVAVRSRARDLVQNNDYAKGYIRNLRINVVGPYGFQMQMNVRKANGDPDDDVNERIQDGWEEFCQRQHCSVDGIASFRGIQDLLIQHAGRDGEALLRPVQMKGSKFGIQLQVVEPEALNEQYNERLSNGNIVKMGVEVNEWRRPVRYYLRKSNPLLELYGGITMGTDHHILPASQIMHGFDREFTNQTRGISWMVQTMFTLRMLGAFEEATVTAARVGASKMGFLVRKQGEGQPYSGPKDDKNNIQMSVSPAQMEQLPDGVEFQAWDPAFPNETHEPFIRKALQRAAAGFGQAYMSISGDLSQANYSSMRAGFLPERDAYRLLQRWMVDTFLQPLFPIWLESAIMSGAIKKLNISDFDRINKPIFIGRSWDWVDPKNDIEAKLMEREAGWISDFDIVGEKGRKLEQVYKDIQEQEKLAKKYNVKPVYSSTKTVSSAPAEPVTDEDETKKVVEEAKALIKTNGSH